MLSQDGTNFVIFLLFLLSAVLPLTAGILLFILAVFEVI